MRTLVDPPPSSHCYLCGGELRLKLIESANRGFDLDSEIFVCIRCGREQSCTVSHNHYGRPGTGFAEWQITEQDGTPSSHNARSKKATPGRTADQARKCNNLSNAPV
jgi:hypothetical protein